MWGLRVLAIVVLIGYTASEDEVIPEYARCANILFNRVQVKLTSEMSTLKTELKNVYRKLDSTCSQQNQVEEVEQERAVPHPNILTKMEELMQKITSMDTKLNEALTKINAMETTLRRTEELPTKADLSHLNGSVSTMLEQTTKSLSTHIEGIPTKAHMEELLVSHVGKVQEAVTAAGESCGTNARLTEVLQEVKMVKGDIEKVTNETEATKEEVKRCTRQDTVQELRNVMTRMEVLQGKVEGLEEGLEEDLLYVKNVIVQVFNNTEPPPPTTPPPTTTTLAPGQVTPCEDSTFRGTNAFSVCKTAVRYNKCRLEAVAYHCCHTCTSQGKLPEMGPWRYMSYSRDITTLDVVRFFAN